jgi:chromosome segregation ATPase
MNGEKVSPLEPGNSSPTKRGSTKAGSKSTSKITSNRRRDSYIMTTVTHTPGESTQPTTNVTAFPSGPSDAPSDALESGTLVNALVPATAALASVQSAIRQVQGDVNYQEEEILELYAEKERLQQEAREAQALLSDARRETQEMHFTVMGAETQNTELFRTLNAEQGTLEALNEEVEANKRKQTFLKEQNNFLRDAEEGEGRTELDADLTSTAAIRAELKAEKLDYRRVFKELQAKLAIELDTFELEKVQYEDKEHYTRKELEEQTEALDASKAKVAKMAGSVLQLGTKVSEREEVLQQQESRLAAVQGELEKETVLMKSQKEDNARLLLSVKEAEAAKETTDKDLAMASEQLRHMAEKVFHLLGELQKLDEWKAEFMDRKRETQDQLSEMRERIDVYAGLLETMTGDKGKLDTQRQEAEEVLLQSRKDYMLLQREWSSKEKHQNMLRKKLSHQESTIKSGQQKHFTIHQRLTAERGRAQQEQLLLQDLQGMVGALDTAGQSLQSQISVLELTIERNKGLLVKVDQQLQQWHEKDPYYQQLAKTLEIYRRTKEQASAAEDAESHPADTRVRSIAPLARMRKVLKSRPESVRMMKKFNLTETMLSDWIEHPPKLLTGFHRVYRETKGLKDHTNTARRLNAQTTERLKMLREKHRDIREQLMLSDGHKVKGMTRLFDLLRARKKEINRQAQERREEAVEPADPQAFTVLLLEEQGIEERELELLCGALMENETVRSIKLKGNRITAHGMLSLVHTCLGPGKYITELDLQQNCVTLDALEALAFMILDVSNAKSGQSREKNPMTANLRREKDMVLPILEVQQSIVRGLEKNVQTLVVDLRYNRLQNTGEPDTAEGERSLENGGEGSSVNVVLGRINTILKLCGTGQQATYDTPGCALYDKWKELRALESTVGLWTDQNAANGFAVDPHIRAALGTPDLQRLLLSLDSSPSPRTSGRHNGTSPVPPLPPISSSSIRQIGK